MNSFPYFPFYPSDYLNDEKVRIMSLAGEGAYLNLLCHQWSEGSIPADRADVVKLCKGNDGPEIDEALKCFTPLRGKVDRLINPRLDRERRKALKLRNSKKKGGLHSANKRWHSDKTPIRQPIAKDKYSESESESYPESEDKNKEVPSAVVPDVAPVSPFLSLADTLHTKVRENVPFQKISEGYREAWAKEFRLMVETDKVPLDQVKAVLEWATVNSFWKVNIRSGSKFREKFGLLHAQMNRPAGGESESVQRERRVGAPGNSFEDRLSDDAKKHLPDLNNEFVERGLSDAGISRTMFLTFRLNEIYGAKHKPELQNFADHVNVTFPAKPKEVRP